MPTSIETAGDFAEPVSPVAADVAVSTVDGWFRGDPGLRGVVVPVGPRHLLLTRRHFDDMMSGRFGYGRTLYQRSTVAALLPATTLAVPAALALTTVAGQILDRDEHDRYDDLLVTYADGRVGVLAVATVFERLADFFQRLALHDPLTGLPNRRHLAEVARALPTDDPRRGPALLYVDLDGFKDVNDVLGHEAGDQLLLAFAARLRGALRPGDTVARIGGDEFAVLLPLATLTQAEAVAERILGLGGTPYLIDHHTVRVSASVGIAAFAEVATERQLSLLDVMLRHADAAMLRAKQAGKNRAGSLPPGASSAWGLSRRAQIARGIRPGLDRDAFTLAYQPEFALANGELVEVEALLRWHDPELGTVAPGELISVAETTGLIHELGRFALTEACAQAARWRADGYAVPVAVNISAVQLATGKLAEEVAEVLRSTGLPATLLRLEVTETAALKDRESTDRQLAALGELGVRISLDDFGTGYSSLSVLRSLPVHALKIDKSFIDQLEDDPKDRHLVRLVIDTAHQLGLTVVAEGVETEAQQQALRELGCDLVQGYLLAHPMPADGIPAVRHRHQTDPPPPLPDQAAPPQQASEGGASGHGPV